MENSPSTRSIKIASDERGGWSSDRPRRDGAPPRPRDVSVRCRVLQPAEQINYAPGSLLLIASASPSERDDFAQRLIPDRSSLLSVDKVRGLLAGRVPEDEIDAKAAELLKAAALKRLEASETVVIPLEGLDAEERDRYVRMADGFKRPRHLILLEVAKDDVPEESRGALNDLRRRLDAGELGAEGFMTALRLGGGSLTRLKQIVFRSPGRDD
jgi:predicted kinase